MTAEANGGRRRVVVIGGGFGGLTVGRELRRANAEVTLVDRTTTTCSSRCSTRWRRAGCPRAIARQPSGDT